MYLRGIDVSHWDGVIDWAKVKDSGIDFAFIKASEGLGVDPVFERNWQGSKIAGIVRGAYHFFHSGKDPIAQAESFLKTTGDWQSGELPCVLDWEVSDSISPAKQSAAALEFLAAVESATKRVPILYSCPSFVSSNVVGEGFAKYPLWIAEYSVTTPMVPAPWKTWTFWQYTQNGTVPGIEGHCDLNSFNGDMAALMKLGTGT